MKRRNVLKALSLLPLSGAAMKLSDLSLLSGDFPKTKKMPVLFVGHGHPMNAILDNDFTRKLGQIGSEIDKPKAILMVSAHWETNGTYISTNPAPKTIYDFGRFDDRLFDIKYEPAGAPDIAREVKKVVTIEDIKEEERMGLDHGAWTVLKFIYPEADVPVFQLSLNYKEAANFHFELGSQLSSLREKGVLIIGSGNVVHNLRQMDWHNINAEPHDWNLEFDGIVKTYLEQRRFKELVNFKNLGQAARLSIPTDDHYLPMLYTLGLTGPSDEIEQIFEGYQYAGISMRCFKIG